MVSAYLSAISYYLPSTVLSNSEISKAHPEWSVEKIAQKTGINKRYIAAPDEYSSDMAVKVALKFFEEHQINKEDIDFLILCTQSPDYFLPTTACILQDKIGLKKSIGAFDFNLGCSGFVYGLGIAKGLVVSQQANNILLITAETYSKFIHPSDKANKTIFGDAAAAVLISSSKSKNFISAEIKQIEYGTDGSGYESLIVKNGGIKNRRDIGIDVYTEENDFERNDDNLYMDGKAVFNFTAFSVPPLIEKTIQKNNLSIENIDLFIFHQANLFMLQTMRKRCKIPEEKFYTNLHCANTVSSTIPIAIKDAITENKINANNKVLLAGFGVGLSLASLVLEY